MRWGTPARGQRLVCLVFALETLLACAERVPESKPKAPTPVRIRVVEERSLQSAARYSGSIEPGTRVDMAFKVGGYIQQLAQTKKQGETAHTVGPGDWVTSGTVLAVVRQSDYTQRVTAARAALADAVAAQKQTQLDFDRATKLLAGSSVSKAEVDNASARLSRANAQVDGANSSIAQAQLSLGDCTLRAPMDGVILERPIEIGSLVNPGALGFVLADTRTVKVVFGAPDTLVEKLKLGSPLQVSLEAAATVYTGQISRIAPSADPKSRVFQVEATIPNPTDQLKVGMIASIEVPEGALSGSSLALPLTAVVRSPRDTRGFSVFVVDGKPGKELARLRDVKLGPLLGNFVLVAEGLKKSERVITMGATLVNDGDAVRVVP
jgi:RND family efflux transporter MFP subunit